MKRRTAILVLVASFALAACGDKNNEENNANNENNENNTQNNTVNNPPNNTMNNPPNNTVNNPPNNTVNNTTGNTVNNTVNNTMGPTPTCDDYCDTVMANCTAENVQYTSRDECIDYCANVAGWEPGEAGAMSGNSIGCRTYHGGDPAAADAAVHCPHAGPTGGNVCGSWCESYCELATKNCTGDNELFADEATCLTACADFNETGAPGDTQYDTVQCRIYHVGAPALADPAVHCPHAGEEPTDSCVGLPTDFRFRTEAPGAYTRADRMGMPAVSTALIASKDAYNDANPSDDVQSTFVTEIVTSITGLHTALDGQLSGAFAVCSMDPDPDCITQTVGAGGPTVASLVVPDTLKIDPTQPAGFPNGRRLIDPVMDVTLGVILLDLTQQAPTDLVGTNPTENDLGVEGAFLTTFPYLHPPHQP